MLEYIRLMISGSYGEAHRKQEASPSSSQKGRTPVAKAPLGDTRLVDIGAFETV